jgi:hypothetical protein
VLFVLISGLSACESHELPDPALEEIFGNWQLFATSGGFSGNGNPGLEVEKMNIAITEDWIYYEYVDGALIAEKDFILYKTEHGGYTEYFMEFTEFELVDDGWEEVFRVFPGNDTLALSYDYNDSYVYHYVRE